jgi:FAD synthase
VPQADLDKYSAWQRLRFDVLIAGDDWFGHERWQHYQERLAEHGVKVIYFPYTQAISSTQIRHSLASGTG